MTLAISAAVVEAIEAIKVGSSTWELAALPTVPNVGIDGSGVLPTFALEAEAGA